DWMEKHRVRRVAGAPILVFGSIALVFAVLLQSGPTIATQVEGLRQQVPAALDQMDGYLAREYGPLVDAILPRDTVATDTVAAEDGASTRLRNAIGTNLGTAREVLFGAVT